MEYWAHSDPDGLPPHDPNAHWQPLAQHLNRVANLAETFAQEANPEDRAFHKLARATGLLHDLGKYSLEFQNLIRGKTTKPAPHSAYGAAVAHQMRAFEAAFAIAGHHAGIPNATGRAASLHERVRVVQSGLERLLREAKADCPPLNECGDYLSSPTSDLHAFDVRTRMLFSCLVDADRIDAAGVERDSAALGAELRLTRLLDFVRVRAASVPEGTVKRTRGEVLERCLAAAGCSGNLFSLTVPTGGAKTLASMAFALERARRFPERVRRIIVVIPYLSIIEQNAQVFMDALGADAILEHHSGDFERLRRLNDDLFRPETADQNEEYEQPRRFNATENWDAPIIVTTSIRFFESLFSNRPSDLRRMHSIARSVMILDEVQTLPRQFIGPILHLMRDLAENWNATFLFCTATQPAFEKACISSPGPRWEPNAIQEIVPEPRRLFGSLRRVDVEWSLAEPTPWKTIAHRMAQLGRAMCIVNTREQAATLYRELAAVADASTLVHLSTRMCAAHRLERIAAVKQMLADAGRRCLVAATQLVEAGVDLDFPVVFRAMAPFEAIIQAAGRCDREGLLTAQSGKPAGKLIVFETEDGKLPPGVYAEATERTRALVRSGNVSIDDPEQIRKYFDRLYGEADLGDKLEELRKNLRFRCIAEEFQMIADYHQPVFVRYGPDARALIEQVEQRGIVDRTLRRKLQRYVVGLNPREMSGARRGAVAEVRRDSNLWICLDGFYDQETGLVLEPHPQALVI